MYNGKKVFAHSLVIELKRGLGAKPPSTEGKEVLGAQPSALGDF